MARTIILGLATVALAFTTPAHAAAAASSANSNGPQVCCAIAGALMPMQTYSLTDATRCRGSSGLFHYRVAAMSCCVPTAAGPPCQLAGLPGRRPAVPFKLAAPAAPAQLDGHVLTEADGRTLTELAEVLDAALVAEPAQVVAMCENALGALGMDASDCASIERQVPGEILKLLQGEEHAAGEGHRRLILPFVFGAKFIAKAVAKTAVTGAAKGAAKKGAKNQVRTIVKGEAKDHARDGFQEEFGRRMMAEPTQARLRGAARKLAVPLVVAAAPLVAKTIPFKVKAGMWIWKTVWGGLGATGAKYGTKAAIDAARN